MNEITERIKKLLALSKNNSNAEEAGSAMKFAARLMMQHNISEQDLREKPKVGPGTRHESEDDRWHMVIANATAMLYNCRAVWYSSTVEFVGRRDNTAVCDVTYPWIVDQVEALYKQHLRKGMTQSERAVYRREFKSACALRVGNRICDIMKTIKAEGVQGSTALVVLAKSEELLAEVDKFFEEVKVRVAKARAPTFRDDQAATEGYKAGDRVKFQRELK